MQLPRNSTHELCMHEFSNTGETCWIFSCNINVWCPTHNEDEASSSVCINSAVHKGGHHLLSHLNQNTHYSSTISDFIFIVCTDLQICCHCCVLQYVTVVLKSKQHCGWCTPWHRTHALPWHFSGFSVSQALWNMRECNSIYANKKTMDFPVPIFTKLANAQLHCFLISLQNSTQLRH